MGYRYGGDDSSEPRDQVSWNMAGDHARHVHNLLKIATTAYLNGNIGKWYWTLSSVREMINHDLSEDERKDLDDVEKKCNVLHSKWGVYKSAIDEGHRPGEKLKKVKSEFSEEVKIYQRKIMDFLKALGYFPSKEDRTQLGF